MTEVGRSKLAVRGSKFRPGPGPAGVTEVGPNRELRPSRLEPRSGDRALAAAIFGVLLGVYLVTYSGVLHSDDEMSMLAVTESLAWQGNTQITQLAWNQNQAGGIGNYGRDGELYSKYGLGQSLWFLPLYLLARLLPNAGLIQTALLLNAPLTALTGALIFAIARRLGSGRGAGLFAAVSFGLGTLAWVYARYGFNEPAVTLGLTLAYFLLLPGADGWRAASGWRAWLAGLALAAVILTRSAMLVTVPVFLALALAPVWVAGPAGAGRRVRAVVRGALALVLPVALAVVVTGVYNAVRFGDPLNSGYNADEGFQGALQEGLYGLLLSPGKSLFLYSPVLFLGVLGFPAFLRRDRLAGLAGVGLVLAILLVNAKWHAWHGGWGWGPRLLLPAIPFLVLAALPVFEQAIAGRPRAVRWVVALLTPASVAVTLLGVLVDFNVYLAELLAAHPQWRAGAMFFTLWDFSNSPFAAHLRLARAGVLDLGWWNTLDCRVPSAECRLGLPGVLGLVVALLFLAGGLFVLWVAWRRSVPRTAWALWGVAAGLTLLGLPATVYGDRRYDADRGAYLAALERIRAEAAATPAGVPRALVAVAPVQTAVLLNYNRALPVRANLSPERGTLRPRTRAWLEALAAAGTRVWLLQDHAPYADPDNAIERALDERGYKASNDWFETARLVRYSLAPSAATPRAADLLFADRLVLHTYAVAGAAPGDVARVDVWWQAVAPITERYALSLRLVAPDGRLRAQRDLAPTDALIPTDRWAPGAEYRDRIGIPLPSDLPAGLHQVQLVVYRAINGEPLPTRDGATSVILDSIKVGR